MKHPEILLLPILMFSDYFLTVLGAIQKVKKYGDHFKTLHYELNPTWQKQISKKQWFNLHHILLTIIFTSILTLLIEFFNMPNFLVQEILGFLFVLFGMIIGRHLSNILAFQYLVMKPNEISGQITMAHTFQLYISTFQYLVCVVPMLIIAFFVPTPFIIGGLFGALSVIVIHVSWIYKHKRQEKTST